MSFEDRPIRVMLVDDYAVVRTGKSTLSSEAAQVLIRATQQEPSPAPAKDRAFIFNLRSIWL